MKRKLSTNDVIKLTGLTRSTLYRWIRNGEFPEPEKIGGMSFWQEESIAKFKKPTSAIVKFDEEISSLIREVLIAEGQSPSNTTFDKWFNCLLQNHFYHSMSEDPNYPVSKKVLDPMNLPELVRFYIRWRLAKRTESDIPYKIEINGRKKEVLRNEITEMQKQKFEYKIIDIVD